MTETCWGIDLGGTKIEGAVLRSREVPELLYRQRIPTEAAEGYRHIIHRVGVLIDQMEQELGYRPQHLGMGTPGTIDPTTGLLKNSNSTALNGQPFLKDLQAYLGMEVRMANDANCLALAETLMGVVPHEAPHARVVFGVIMGTGVGGGIVIDGKALTGSHGIAGEWGHAYLDASGGDCYCGDTGCVERILAGPALERYYVSIGGVQLKLKDIYQHHLDGDDPLADQTMERLIHFFGIGLSNVVNIIDPDVIVIGGGVGNIDLLYTQGEAAINQHAFNPGVTIPVLKPRLGDSAGVFGAAFL